MNTIIHQLTEENIRSSISRARGKIFFCSQGISKIICTALADAAKRGIEVEIITNLTSDNDYFGVGDLKAASELIGKENIKVKSSNGISISFFISPGNFNCILFPESAIFKRAATGYNAIEIDEYFSCKIIQSFWQNENVMEYAQNNLLEQLSELNNLKEQNQPLSIVVENIFAPDKKKIENEISILKNNPPQPPDLRRNLELVKRTIQFIDIKFKGVKIESRRFDVANDLIPIEDANLKSKLDTKLKLFSEINSNETYKKLLAINSKVEALREDECFKIKSKEYRIFKIREKKSLIDKLEELKMEAKELKQNLEKELFNEFDRVKTAFYEEMKEYYRKKPTDELIEVKNNSQLFEQRLNRKVEKLLNKLEKIDPTKIINDIELKWSFYDITLEDYTNEKFLDEIAGWNKLSQEEYQELFNRENVIGVKS